MAKRFSSRGLSKHRSYTLEEAALIIGASKQTLRQWANSDKLNIMTSRKPHMVHGSELMAYLETRKRKKRPRLRDGEFDCWSCGRRGQPFGLMADYAPFTPKTGRLAALCGGCEGNVGRIIGAAGLAQYSTILEIVNRET